MEKKRKRIRSTNFEKKASFISSSKEQKPVKMVSYQQEKDKEQNYLNKPSILFK